MTDSPSSLPIVSPAEEVPARIPLPRRWIESFGLRNSPDQVNFERDQTVVIVGANNAGKSALLKELYAGVCSQNFHGNVVGSVSVGNSAELHELITYLQQNHQISTSRGEPTFWGPGFHTNVGEIMSMIPSYPHGQPPTPAFFPSFYAAMLSTMLRATSTNKIAPISSMTAMA